jgi:hypothetical protein
MNRPILIALHQENSTPGRAGRAWLTALLDHRLGRRS